MRVTLLGTGTPGPNPHRRQSAVLIGIGGDLLLVDVGRGAVHQMARLGVDVARVDPLLVTHHHFDHIGELFDLVITAALSGRTEPLEILGPTGTCDIVRALIEQVYARDLRSRPGVDPATLAAPRDVESGAVMETGAWRVIAEPVRHGDFPEDPGFDWNCLGYRIEAEGKALAISGDSVPCPGLARLAAGADLLVQCCHFPQSALVDESVRALTTDTLPSAAQAGRIATEAGVRRLVLTHISMQADPEELLADARREFDGDVIVGEDLMAIDL